MQARLGRVFLSDAGDLVLAKAHGLADSTVLILGETGTGKELIARSIHKRSVRYSHDPAGIQVRRHPLADLHYRCPTDRTIDHVAFDSGNLDSVAGAIVATSLYGDPACVPTVPQTILKLFEHTYSLRRLPDRASQSEGCGGGFFLPTRHLYRSKKREPAELSGFRRQ